MAAGEPLVELETDKIDLEVAAPQAGVLSRIRKDGADVKVGEVLGVIEELGIRRSAGRDEAAQPPGRSRGRSPRRPRASPRRRQKATAEKYPRSTPTARKAAEEHDVESGAGSGKRRGWPRDAA